MIWGNYPYFRKPPIFGKPSTSREYGNIKGIAGKILKKCGKVRGYTGMRWILLGYFNGIVMANGVMIILGIIWVYSPLKMLFQ